MEKNEISIVVPIFRETEIIRDFYHELNQVMKKIKTSFEIIFVHDDCPESASMQILKDIYNNDPHVKIIGLSRNFGQQVALTAGIDYASGDAVITLDGDLQHPPELILELISYWRNGYDIVYTIRKDVSGEGFIKKFSSKLFYFLMQKISDTDFGFNCADFRLMSRKVVCKFKSIREKARFIRGLVSWMGYKNIGVPFTGRMRKGGRTKYSYRKMFGFALDGLISFSNFPIKMISVTGIVVSFLGFFYILRVIYFVFFQNQGIPDYLPILTLILFLIGLQMIMLGVLGEYIAKIFTETKNRPLYLVDEIYDKTKK